MLAIKHRHEPIPDKSYSSMQVIENSIAAAWCRGVRGLLFLSHHINGEFQTHKYCDRYRFLVILIAGVGSDHSGILLFITICIPACKMYGITYNEF